MASNKKKTKEEQKIVDKSPHCVKLKEIFDFIKNIWGVVTVIVGIFGIGYATSNYKSEIDKKNEIYDLNLEHAKQLENQSKEFQKQAQELGKIIEYQKQQIFDLRHEKQLLEIEIKKLDGKQKKK